MIKKLQEGEEIGRRGILPWLSSPEGLGLQFVDSVLKTLSKKLASYIGGPFAQPYAQDKSTCLSSALVTVCRLRIISAGTETLQKDCEFPDIVVRKRFLLSRLPILYSLISGQ